MNMLHIALKHVICNPPQNILQQTTKVGNVDLKTKKKLNPDQFPPPPNCNVDTSYFHHKSVVMLCHWYDHWLYQLEKSTLQMGGGGFIANILWRVVLEN